MVVVVVVVVVVAVATSGAGGVRKASGATTIVPQIYHIVICHEHACMCIYIYMNIHAYIHTYIHTYILISH